MPSGLLEETTDGSPFKVPEFIAYDSRPPFDARVTFKTKVTFTPGGHEPETEVEQCPSELIGNFYWDRQRKYSWRSVFIREEHQMNNERKSSKAGERAAGGLREATAREEAKNESKTGHDLAKGADRFEERSKSSDGKCAQEKQKG
jgi:hypothetical protein